MSSTGDIRLRTILRDDRLLAAATFGLILVYLIPLWAVRHPPMQDLPGHLSMIELWRTVGSGKLASVDAGYAHRPGLPPYLAYYATVRLLGSALPLELANKLVLSAYVAGLPLAFLYLLVAFGRPGRGVLLCFPLIYNTCFVYGFIPNVVGFPLLLWALGLLQRYLAEPTLRRELTLGLLVILLYFAHVTAFFAFAVTGPVIFFAQVHRLRAIVRRSLFALPAIAVALWWSQTTLHGGGFAAEWRPIGDNFKVLASWINDIYRGSADELALLVTVLTAGAMLLLRPPPDPARPIRAPWSLGAAGLLLLVAFFAAPGHVHRPMYQWMTNARLAVPATLLLLTLPRGDLRGRRALVLVPLLIVSIGYGAIITKNNLAFARELHHLERVMARLPADRRVLPLLYDTDDRIHRSRTLLQIPMLYIVRKGGYLPYTFAGHPVMPVQFRGGPAPAPPWKNPHAFRYEQYGRYYDYFLAIYPPGERVPPTLPTADAHVELVAHSGRFALYRNRDRPPRQRAP